MNDSQPIAKNTRGGHDAPINDVADDLLGSFAIARALHRIIRSTPIGWSTRIGLYGRWGTGKTSVLNLLEKLEIGQESIVVRLSAWSASGESGVLSLIYEALAKKLGESGVALPWTGQAKRAVQKAKRFVAPGRAMLRAGEHAQQLPGGTAELISGAAEIAIGWTAIGADDLKRLVNELNERRVVVFIDDLDRADPRAIPKTLLALRELLDWPGFSFVLAFDKQIISRALGEYSKVFGDDADAFLAKIVDIPFELPTPSDTQVQRLTRVAFKKCCEFVPPSAIEESQKWMPHEPRGIKHIARALGILREVALRHDENELDWTGIVWWHLAAEIDIAATAWLEEQLSRNDGEWERLLFDSEKQGERDRTLREQVVQATGRALDATDAKRLGDLAVALLNRSAYINPEKFKYERRLATSEPCWTWMELRALFDKWAKAPADFEIEIAIQEAARRGSSTTSDACVELVRGAVEYHSMLLSNASESGAEIELIANLGKVRAHLDFLNYLWGENPCREIRSACEDIKGTQLLVEVVTRWVAWTRNKGEPAIRQCERKLALYAAKMANAKSALYEKTDPFWNSHLSSDARAAQIEKLWRDELRSLLLEDILLGLFEKFGVKDGLASCVTNEDSVGLWLLESPKSPIYGSKRSVSRLIAAVTGKVSKAQPQVLSENARFYLIMLLGKARNSSWAGSERIKELMNQYPNLIPSAWRTVISVRSQYRLLFELRELRKELITLGAKERQLRLPKWLLVS